MRSIYSAPSRSPARRGFSLIELLTMVAVVGIMMSIVVPRMRISEATEVQLAGMQLAQDMDLARTRALSTRSIAQVSFSLSSSSPSYSGYLDVDADSVISYTAAEKLGLQAFGTRPLPDHIVMARGASSPIPGDVGGSAVTFPGYHINFDTRGLPSPMGTSGVVYLTNARDDNAVVAVEVSPSGSVRLWTWKNGGWQ